MESTINISNSFYDHVRISIPPPINIFHLGLSKKYVVRNSLEVFITSSSILHSIAFSAERCFSILTL
ncbi:hypothetical protein WBZ18_13250 [Clostridium botulinum]|uniref:hypothetical protein n=1 Tax=Clostridium botulinum TaxID=1491 RepID=UPI0005F94E93|nr:hypothetical protein [Clostridium botulinum]MBY6756345.1 hypothetical protein [Clostridium botulinum]WGZ45314.1 hypothetical protein HEQ52_03180 [Clostridium botulinum]HDI3025768.1 hypothetical protein [Clostridium botulinum]HDI3029414.1 hypothetical protein [Clostridium botulinum]HDI3037630.1 hypothetical protein [Clostridium botulinum]